MKDIKSIDHDINIPYRLRIYFSKDVFSLDNSMISDLLFGGGARRPVKVIVYIDDGVPDSFHQRIRDYFAQFSNELDL